MSGRPLSPRVHRSPVATHERAASSKAPDQRAAIYRAFDKRGVLAEQDFPTRPTSRGLSPWH
ncbi:hypothetical protein DA456_03045 [Pseudomonas syringae pv. atrofaciens]|uniref:Uncharacterized protein n=1 Tax=Pseudomonas syringae pv. atrofaciens TaxID=192087 RepID=A0AAD0I5L9_PSESX|nr:hypothetical protein DA456_03045 [Pseudomonas syringae pv. atrofaciens]NAO51582.1 hypothetical protein [Pseudomonas syringae]